MAIRAYPGKKILQDRNFNPLEIQESRRLGLHEAGSKNLENNQLAWQTRRDHDIHIYSRKAISCRAERL
jgi:hypothetical protein